MPGISAVRTTPAIHDPAGNAPDPVVRRPTAGRIPENVLQGWNKAAQGFRLRGDIAQLDKAEAMAQDAFKKASRSNATFADIQQAQNEMQQVDEIRKSVEKDLSPNQQEALEHINGEEQNAVGTATRDWTKSQLDCGSLAGCGGSGAGGSGAADAIAHAVSGGSAADAIAHAVSGNSVADAIAHAVSGNGILDAITRLVGSGGAGRPSPTPSAKEMASAAAESKALDEDLISSDPLGK